ncbi:hypothetical protein MLD38_007245 [Melastoma candidum]|uniref:Uncharacterized protein n=2 Tax=Melastoma candidum TaxID=119954 RepID=A0ACB9RQ53_9MYRT|nr:hypothetical protein MLD38_007241 [Melastoma candidum]KAI4381137.1 hypothetical protein MLD38_007245 [Melastoma candidum]
MLSRRLLFQPRQSSQLLPLQLFPLSSRHRSSRSGKLIEIDLDSALPSSSFHGDSDADADSGSIGLRGLEESLHSILALRYTPDWIPFLPGASFWVPPRTLSAVHYLGHLASPFSDEDSLPFSSPRGWPCFHSLYHLDGASTATVDVESESDSSRPQVVEIQVQVLTASEDGSESGDDE